MSFELQELRIKSKEPEKQIEEIRRWLKTVREQLNYELNHLDDTNSIVSLRKKEKSLPYPDNKHPDNRSCQQKDFFCKQ